MSGSDEVTRLIAAIEKGDADALAELMAPDVAFHSPLTDR